MVSKAFGKSKMVTSTCFFLSKDLGGRVGGGEKLAFTRKAEAEAMG